MANVHELKLENLQFIDGGLIAAAFNSQVEQCIKDCDDRPGHSAVREVTLKIKFKPIQSGKDLDTVQATFEVQGKTPKLEAPPVSMAFRKKRKANGESTGTLVFNELSPDDPFQQTIPMGDD